MKKKLLLVAFTVTLFGCMTSSPKSYEALTTRSHFVFEQDVMVPTKISVGFAKGRYEAVFESNDFVYYLGPAKALMLNELTRVNGGIAVPKPSSALGCHLFIQVGDDSQVVREMGLGPVVAGLSKLEAGRIREFKNDPQCDGITGHIYVVQG